MKNEDFAWIIVRAFGIYFLVQFFLHLFSLSSVTFTLITLYEIASSSVSLAEKAEMKMIRTWINVGVLSFQLVAFGLLSYYCLRKGAFIHRLLMFRQVTNEQT